MHERAVGHAVGDPVEQRRARITAKTRVDDLDGGQRRHGIGHFLVRVRASAGRHVALETERDLGFDAQQRHGARGYTSTRFVHPRAQQRAARHAAIGRRADFPAADRFAEPQRRRRLDRMRLRQRHRTAIDRKGVERGSARARVAQDPDGFGDRARRHRDET